jgi:hypothetical protein
MPALRLFLGTASEEVRMTAQQKREKPEIAGGSQKHRPEMPGHTPSRPEMTGPDTSKPETPGRGRPGAMPENPASVDHKHEPAGIDSGTDRTGESSTEQFRAKRGRS